MATNQFDFPGTSGLFPGWECESRGVVGWAAAIGFQPVEAVVGKSTCQPSSDTTHSSRKDASGLGQTAGIALFLDAKFPATPRSTQRPTSLEESFIHLFIHSPNSQQKLRGRLLGVKLGAERCESSRDGRGDSPLTRKQPRTEWAAPSHLLDQRQSDTCTSQEENWGQRGTPQELSPTPST